MPAPPRTRDFRLTAEQADKLRGSAFERFFRSLTGSGWTVLRPAAGVALSIGLVMSVVGILPTFGGLAAGPAAAPTSEVTVAADPLASDGRSGVDAPAAENDDPSRIDVVSDNVDNAYLDEKAGSPAPDLAPIQLAPAARDTGLNSRDFLFVGGLTVTALALAVLGLLYAARRRFTDPLLR